MRMMSRFRPTRRNFLKAAGVAAGTTLLSPRDLMGVSTTDGRGGATASDPPADYTPSIAAAEFLLCPSRRDFASTTRMCGQGLT